MNEKRSLFTQRDLWKEIFVYAKRPCYLWSRKETLLCGTRKESLLCGTRQPCWRLYVEHDSHVGVYMQNAQDTHCETRIECIVKHTTNTLCNTQKKLCQTHIKDTVKHIQNTLWNTLSNTHQTHRETYWWNTDETHCKTYMKHTVIQHIKDTVKDLWNTLWNTHTPHCQTHIQHAVKHTKGPTNTHIDANVAVLFHIEKSFCVNRVLCPYTDENGVTRSFHLQTPRGGGLGSRPKKMYGERLGDGVEFHLMSPTPRR